MSGLRKKMLNAFGILCVIGTVLEYLALPVLFLVIGLVNDFGWPYYAWTIGGYILVVALVELTGALIGRALGNAVGSRLARKLNSAKERPHNCAE